MPRLRCSAKTCLHHDNASGFCSVTDDTIIDVSIDGKCVDYSPVTDEEYRAIVGEDRK